MDLNELAVFVKVVDFGSFSRAAAALRQPKSRVSRRVAALERELETSLIYRTTRQFHLTDAGRTLYEAARTHVYELELLPQALREHAKDVTGTLRITAAEDFGSVLLGPVIAEVTEQHPKLAVDLRLSNEFLDLVREGLDLGIWIGDLGDSTYKRRLLGHVSLIPVASPEYLGHAPKLEVPQDLTRHKILAFAAETDGTTWHLQRRGRTEDVARLQVACRSNNPRVLVDLALAGKGVALVPEFLCVDALARGSLVRVLSPCATRAFPIHFVWPGQRTTSPKVKAFLSVAMARLGKYFS